jgi:ribonucleoside-diphosphate reductase alpha chain
MISTVTKRDGTVQDFDPDKLNKWAQYATKHGVSWSELAKETYKRLTEGISTEDIQETMIKVCLSKEDINWSRVAARLEFATIRSGMKTVLGFQDRTPFKVIFKTLVEKGYWCSKTMPKYNPTWESWYQNVFDNRLEFWQIKQWNEKYAIKEGNHIIETPHIGALGMGLAIHGDTLKAFEFALAVIQGKINLPTPVLNGCRNGDFDGISCCVITGGDSVESIEVAKHISSRMTAKKAGIGIEYRTRSKGAPVKGGKVKHLGKTPIYAAVDKAVKMFTQVTRGGSATMTYTAHDPEIKELLLLKSQRTPENRRIDKLDYSFAYNEAFLNAVISNSDWYLYDYHQSRPMYDNFHLPADEYIKLAESHIPVDVINARELLKIFLTTRGETGRVYCFNVTRANEHTPFIDTITLSNLCQEIALPTKAYTGMEDLYAGFISEGETAFCALSAANVSVIEEGEHEDIADLIVTTINILIDKAPMMTHSMKESILRRRSIGVGIAGLAGALYKAGLDYDSPEAKQFVSEIAEKHAFYLYKASIEYATRTNTYCEGIDNYWLPIDTRKGDTYLTMDWESLRFKDRANSVLVAHMPTESSAVFSNATNGLYPVRSRITEKLSRKGKVQYIAPPGNYKTAWEHNNNTLAEIYGIVQDFTDQGISADYYVVPKSFPEGKVPLTQLVKEWVAQARFGNKSMYYTNTNDYTGGSMQNMVEQVEEDDGCASGACKI